jgi:hypothetical protein
VIFVVIAVVLAGITKLEGVQTPFYSYCLFVLDILFSIAGNMGMKIYSKNIMYNNKLCANT